MSTAKVFQTDIFIPMRDCNMSSISYLLPTAVLHGLVCPACHIKVPNC